MTDLSAQIVTGAFTIAAVALTLAGSALARRGTERREDRLQFNRERLQAASTLIASAQSYRTP